MAIKDYYVPETFIKAMSRDVKGFNNLSAGHQARMAFHIWMADTNRRKHISGHGMTIGYRDLEKGFGRGGFARINGALGIFDVSPNWSKVNKETKSYKLTEQVQRAKDKHLAKVHKKLTALITLDGQEMRTLPGAIASKGSDNITAIAWKGAKLLNPIPVDLSKMMELWGYLKNMQLTKTGDLFMDAPADDITYRIGILSQLIRLANTAVAGRGYIPHRYTERKTARLYAEGISLQNSPRLLRKAALHGLYDYDIENCHYSIFCQLAGQYNFECEAIKYYLSHKKQVRETIAKDVGITIQHAKDCLLALMFGARLSEWKDNSIPKAIGQNKAHILFNHPRFKAIADDVLQGRKLILEKHTKRKTTLLNVMGKSISLKEPPNKQLAHIIQGIEAQALKASLALYPDDVVLLMHDGFVSKKALDVSLIEQAIYEDTGMKLELSRGLITLPADLDFSKVE